MTGRWIALVAAAGLIVTGCGDDKQDEASTGGGGAATTAAAPAEQYGAVKDYLLAHTARLQRETAAIEGHAQEYFDLAKDAGFDYAQLLDTQRDKVTELVEALQEDFVRANPAYEEMEGVVAGVPSLADFDVQIDAGSDASEPDSAVSFDIETTDGREFKQPGNFNFLVETTVFGTERKFQARGVKADLDDDGTVEFGEALPDAQLLLPVATDFAAKADELDAAAKAWKPTTQDVLTALVVMTPTMSEYFDAWKNSRFVAGDKSEETAFVAASRLQDIEDILGGLVLVYDNVKAEVAKADAAQADQTGESLKKLHEFAGKLRQEEADGKKFTAGDADTLGSEAQARAEAIAGQISQAAGKLDITLET